MRGVLFGLGVLSLSHVLLVIWRYGIIPLSFVWPISLICIGVIILAISELIGKEVTRFLECITTSHKYALSFIILVSVLANLSLIGPGNIHGDGIFHVFKVWYLRKAWMNGIFYPIWCPYWYSGYPFLEFYGPLFYVFAALLSLGTDWMTGSKFAIYFACILSSLTMYGLIYVITQDRLGGIVGGLAYTLTYYKFPLLTKFGHLASSLEWFFLPLLFLFLELAIKREKHIFAVYAGFCWAGIFLTHAGDGYMISFLVIFYLIISSIIKFNLENIYFIGRLALISGTITLGLSAFFLIPYLLDSVEANTRLFVYPGKLGDPISLPLILTRDFVHINQPFPIYIGNSILIIAFLAIFLRRNRASIVYTASLLFSLFFVLGSAVPFYSEIPLITSLDYFPYRFLLLVSFVASVLSGLTIASLKDIQKPFSAYLKKFKSKRKLQKHLIVVLMVIIVIDLWPGTLISKNRPLSWMLDDNWINTYNWLNEHPGYHKIIRLDRGGPPNYAYHAIIGNTFDTAGAFGQAENQEYSSFKIKFEGDIKSLKNTPRKGLLTPLRLLGVRYLIIDSSRSYAKYLIESSKLDIMQTNGNVMILEYNEYTSPVIISQAAALVEADNEINEYYSYVTDPDYDPSKMIFLKATKFDYESNVPLNLPEDFIDDKSNFNSDTLELEIKENTISAKVYISAPSFVYFSFSYFPGWKALVDGTESNILIAEPNFMCLYIDKAGTHNISLKYSLNPPKTVGIVITLSTFLVSLFMMAWPSRQTFKETIELIIFRKRKGKKVNQDLKKS